MAALQEILDEQARIKRELQRMEDSEETTEENDGDLRDTLVARWQELDKKAAPIIERMERIKAITRTADDEGNLERPDGNDGDGGSDGRYHGGSPDLMTGRYRDRNPYEDLDAVRHHVVRTAELRGRAFDAIEMESRHGNLAQEYAENATRLIQEHPGKLGRGIAEHMLLTGSEEYQSVFRAYMEDPQGNAQRAALSLTQLNGGYLLPFVLDPTIILTNTGSANPWRRISNVKQTTSNTWAGVTSTGVNAAWLAEGAPTVGDNSPTVGQVLITPQKAAAWVFGSYEVLEDTDFGQQLPRLLADAKDRLEENAFAVGTGGTQPSGVITGATTTVNTATTLVIAVGDIYAVQAALPPRFRNAPNCAWVANVAIINKFRQLDTAGGASFWTNLGKGQPETLIGAPIYESTSMSGTTALNSLEAVMGDFSQFLIVDRVGVSLIYEPLVKNAAGPFPTGQAGWFMFWRTGSQVAVPNAFRVLKGA